MSIDEFLAVEVMGFIEHRNHYGIDDDGTWKPRIEVKDFTPTTNIAQAIDCAKAFISVREYGRIVLNIYTNGEAGACIHINPEVGKVFYNRETEAAALSEAVARAAGWEE